MSSEKKQDSTWILMATNWPKPDEANTSNIMEIYNSWEDYDKYMDDFGYKAPMKLAKAVLKIGIPLDALIIDVGCGTGFLGEALRNCGYRNVDGHDGSQQMLEQAQQKGIYKNYIQCLIGNGVQFPINEGTYDAVLACGMAAPGHFDNIAFFAEMLRIVKIGGYFGHTFRTEHLKSNQLKDLTPFFDSLIEQGKLKATLEESHDEYYTAFEEVHIDKRAGKIQIYQKLQHI